MLNKNFSENDFIKANGKLVHFNEIVHPEEFKKIYSLEKRLIKLKKEIKINVARPFINIPSIICKNTNIKPQDVLITRFHKGNKVCELISKVYSWGKIHIPRKIINSLNLKNNEKVNIEIIKEADNVKSDKDVSLVDLFKNNNKVKIIKRANNFVTLYTKQQTPLTVPNNIKLTPQLIELFFLIHGDGHYKTKLFFVNKNPQLHEFVIKQFRNQLKIPESIWRARINLNKSKNEDFAKDYWIKKIKFNEKQFYPTISKTKFQTLNRGNLRICIDYLIVAEVFRTIFEEIKNSLNFKLSLHALNGLLYAEGGAQISKVGLHKITLSYNKEEKELFKQILKNTNLSHLFKEVDKENKGTFVLEKWDNFYPFFKEFLSNSLIPFQQHNRRKNNAFHGFLRHSFTKTSFKYLTAIRSKEEMTVKKLSNILNIREDSCLSTIRKKQYQKFIKINGKGINRNPFKISVTQEGNNLLNLISKIKQEARHE